MEVSSAEEEEGYGLDGAEWRQRRDERVRREQAQVQQIRLEIAMQNKVNGVATGAYEATLRRGAAAAAAAAAAEAAATAGGAAAEAPKEEAAAEVP